MVRVKIDLEPYRSEILKLRDLNFTVPNIILTLQENHNLSIQRSTLYTYLKRWDAQKQQRTDRGDLDLRLRLKKLYYDYALGDTDLLTELRSEGFQITLTGLRYLRRDMGVYRRQDDPAQVDAVREQMIACYENLDQTDEITVRAYGRTHLMAWIRQQEINISRDAAWKIYCDIYPDEVDRRRARLERRRPGWTTPGPNYTWSIDGYQKLQAWGIEIYAGVDAYSRYVPWFYVGISSNTARNIFAQYLIIIKKLGYLPTLLRCDRGGETVIAGAAHFWLSSAVRSKPVRSEDGNTQNQSLNFKDCVIYGKSIHNQRVESWWSQLCNSATIFWRQYFAQLSGEGIYTADLISDQIALLYIYVPMIRKHLFQFVRTWNCHRIRSQPNRPHAVTGKPYMLYHHPDPEKAKDYQVPLDTDQYELLADLCRPELNNMHHYLPTTTMTICDKLMEEFEQQGPLNAKTPMFSEYNYLRQRLASYHRDQQQPLLSLLEHPTGGGNSLLRQLNENGFAMPDLDDVESENDDD